MNPESQYLPIPGPTLASARLDHRPFGLHQRNDLAPNLSMKNSSPNPCETASRYNYVPPELELNVKGLYNDTCYLLAITTQDVCRVWDGNLKSMCLCNLDQELSEAVCGHFFLTNNSTNPWNSFVIHVEASCQAAKQGS